MPSCSRTASSIATSRKEWRNQQVATDRRRVLEAYIPMYEDVAERMVRREVQDIERALDKFTRKRNLDDFYIWLAEYYKDFRPVLADAFRPVMMSLATLIAQNVAAELGLDTPTTHAEVLGFIDEYLDDFAEGMVAAGQGQLVALAREVQQEEEGLLPDFIVKKLKGRLSEWLEKKGTKIALRQAFRAGNGLVVANYTAKGVRALVWAASGDTCPFCERLDGKIISITEFFITAGEMLSGNPDDAPMLIRHNTRHGPIHSGCDCTVVAG